MNIHELDLEFDGTVDFPYKSPHLALLLKDFQNRHEEGQFVYP